MAARSFGGKREMTLFSFSLVLEPHGPWLKSDVPTVIGLGVGMSIFMALTCLVLKLFSRARFAQDQARGYGNAHLAPPTSASTNNTHAGSIYSYSFSNPIKRR